MSNPVATSEQRCKRDRRLLHRLAFAEAETHLASKVFIGKNAANLSPREAAIQVFDLKVITGEALSTFIDSANRIYVRNVNLVDSNARTILLRRFEPRSSKTASDMEKSAQRDKNLFPVVTELARRKKHKAVDRQTLAQRSFPYYHFGARYDRYKTNLVLTGETLQVGNEAGKKPATDFCAWSKTSPRATSIHWSRTLRSL